MEISLAIIGNSKQNRGFWNYPENIRKLANALMVVSFPQLDRR